MKTRKTPFVLGSLAALTAVLGAAVGVGSCSKTPETPLDARAYRVTDRAQLIGGPTALGDIGDYMLENGEVRVLVQDKGFNRGAGVFGGSLIDADVARATNDGSVLGGTGNDSFGEMFPAFFLEMINPEEIEVINDGSNGEAAIVEIRGRGGEFVTMLRYLNQLLLSSYKEPATVIQDVLAGRPPDSDSEPNLLFRTRYILEPGARHVRIESSMRNVSVLPIQFPAQEILAALAGFAGLDLGGFRLPAGHVLGFGKLSEIFLPGLGYDIEIGLREASTEPVALPAFPGFLTPVVASTNEHGANYGFATEDNPQTNFVYQRDQDGLYGGRARSDDMLYLFNASGFGGVFTTQAPEKLAPDYCQEGLDPDTVCAELFPEQLALCKSQWNACVAAREEFGTEFTYTNYLIIGDGDVASLMEEFYRIRGADVELVRGRVVDDTTGSPVPERESVLIYQRGDGSCAEASIYNQVFTIDDGRFQLDLPVGNYCARSQASGRPLGDFVEFTVAEERGAYVEVAAKARGHIAVRVAGTDGVPMPAKITVVGTHEYREGADYREFLMDQVAGEPHRPTDLIPDDPNDPTTRQFIETMAYGGADGIVEIDVRPGTYTVYVSRGLEYGLEAREVDVKPARTSRLSVTLPRLLDTTGYVSGDFHMHQAGSIDSGLDFTRRVKSVAAEGVEVVVSTEHNYISDLSPYIYRSALHPWLKSVVGIELTTFEAGHFNGFPVERTWQTMNRGSFAWQEIPPDRIFEQMRKMAPGGQDNIIQVNHPRTPIMGYFEQHNVSPFDTSVDLAINQAGGGFSAATLASPNGPAFIETIELADGKKEFRSTFSWDFDMIEVFNGPHLEELRHFRMPFDKDAAAGEPGALPQATRDGLAASFIEAEGNRLDDALAAFLNERDGTELTDDDVAALPEAERNAVIDAWVQTKIPPQWSILCDGNGVVRAGALDDWYNLLNHPRPDGTYRKYGATGNSDSHSDYLDPPGLPRNFFYVGHDNPQNVTDGELVTALQKRHNIVSNGPFVDFTVNGTPVGGELSASGSVTLDVRIAAVPWIGADRFRVIANGEVVHGLADNQDPGFWGWIPIELDADGEFRGSYTVDTDGKDTWFVIEVESDKSMFPVIEPQDIPPFNFDDVIGGLAGAFGFGAGVEGLMPSFVFPLTGFAFTNPIWVVADGDGEFTPPSPPVFTCVDGVWGPTEGATNALLDAREIERVMNGRLRTSSMPGVRSTRSPLERPRGEHRDLRIIFDAWSHSH